MIRASVISYLICLAITAQAAETAVEPTRHHKFKDLLTAVAQLRTKTLPEAYFLLDPPQLTAPPFFIPDTKGGAYFLLPVHRVLPPSSDGDIELKAALKPSSLYTPTYDARSRKLTFYPADVATVVRKQLAPWLLSQKEVAVLPEAKLADEMVAAKIPLGSEAEFLDALLESLLHTTRIELKCIIGWN